MRNPQTGYQRFLLPRQILIHSQLSSAAFNSPWTGKSFSSSSAAFVSNELRIKKKNAVPRIFELLKHYVDALRSFTFKGSLNEGKGIHGQVIKTGAGPDAYIWSSLVNLYSKCRDFRSAGQVLDEMPQRDVVSWTALIAGLIDGGYWDEGIHEFCKMHKEGLKISTHTIAAALKGCSVSMHFSFGEQLHTEVIKHGFFSEVFLGSSFVNFYAKCGEIELAQKVFSDMPEHDLVSWTTLMDGYADNEQGETVLKLFSRIEEPEIKFSCFTLSIVLKGCANSDRITQGQSIHSLAIKINSHLHEYVNCSLLNMYSKCLMQADAMKVFHTIKHPNVVAWTEMISCHIQLGQFVESIDLFHDMVGREVKPNHFTFVNMVNAATLLGDHLYGKSIHTCIYKHGFTSDRFINTAVINMYMKFGSVIEARQVFDEITHKDSSSWNALLSGFHDITFKQMLEEGFEPDMYTFVNVLNSLDIRFGKQIHVHVIKNGFDKNNFVATTLICMYANGRISDDARSIFDRLHDKDVSTWTAMISCHARNDESDDAIRCFSRMRLDGERPNECTISSCLSSCLVLETGKQIHSLAIKIGLAIVTAVANAIINMYVNSRAIEYAEAVFDELVERDVLSWNTIICGYAQHGKGNIALRAFHNMLDEDYVPDKITFVGVLSACSHSDDLIDKGIDYFNSMFGIYGIIPEIHHYGCLVSILCRAGKFNKAVRLIEDLEMSENCLMWEKVLWRCKLYGNLEFGEKAALKLFELEPEVCFNYILLSDIYAGKEMWEEVAKVRGLMSKRVIEDEPARSWVEVDGRFHMFFAQDCLNLRIREICRQLGRKQT
ncbi:pentatricopeptide repeat-containing protein At2g33680-like [Impatiens glandulifera]|uniref:pentatricopeptide repeat-containing protein At2g33680-like n=1 Tax=Impatiens glandulifera TaxID=253017 RepID=UPI001FB128C4|nr:pentatricopeptide repeat-containing protein At2g33680-like [Impatiens glandulifera]